MVWEGGGALEATAATARPARSVLKLPARRASDLKWRSVAQALEFVRRGLGWRLYTAPPGGFGGDGAVAPTRADR